MTNAQPGGKQPSLKKRRQRQFFVMLPVIVLPFLTFLLWSIGLVGSESANAQGKAKPKVGINTDLPDPKLKEGNLDKLSFYQQADKDSAKLQAAMKADPFYSRMTAPSVSDSGYHLAQSSPYPKQSYDPAPPSYQGTASSEQKLNDRLSQLNAALNQSQAPADKRQDTPLAQGNTVTNGQDIDRLQKMLDQVSKRSGPDPEMQDINRVMENILDIQHPERVKDRLQQVSEKNKQQVYPIVLPAASSISVLTGQADRRKGSADTASGPLYATAVHNGFFGLSGEEPLAQATQNTIKAVVSETQTLVSGATVKLRLAEDIYIAGVLIPKDNFLYGTASLNGERLIVTIPTVRYENMILPVKLAVYDMDGLEGIYIPGAITRDVAKQTGDEAVQGIGLTTLDPSIGAQAASAGIQAAKTLVSKKIKLVRVQVKAGYEVLLKDTNNKQ